MVWLAGALTVACLAVGLLHVVRMLVLRADVFGEMSHAAMGVGMAAMFSPMGDPVPGPVWTIVFVACGAWFVAVALRAGTMVGDAGHHIVGSGAMLFMLVGGHSHAAGLGGAGHPGPGGGAGLVPAVAMVLAGYFGWHVLRCADRIQACVAGHGDAARPANSVVPGSGPAVAVAIRSSRTAVGSPRPPAVAHLVIGVAMTVILLGIL